MSSSSSKALICLGSFGSFSGTHFFNFLDEIAGRYENEDDEIAEDEKIPLSIASRISSFYDERGLPRCLYIIDDKESFVSNSSSSINPSDAAAAALAQSSSNRINNKNNVNMTLMGRTYHRPSATGTSSSSSLSSYQSYLMEKPGRSTLCPINPDAQWEKFKFSKTSRSFLDFANQPPPSKSVVPLHINEESFYKNPTGLFSTDFSNEIDTMWDEEIEDRLRHLLETNDLLKNITISSPDADGFSTLSWRIQEYLQQEVPKINLKVFSGQGKLPTNKGGSASGMASGMASGTSTGMGSGIANGIASDELVDNCFTKDLSKNVTGMLASHDFQRAAHLTELYRHMAGHGSKYSFPFNFPSHRYSTMESSHGMTAAASADSSSSSKILKLHWYRSWNIQNSIDRSTNQFIDYDDGSQYKSKASYFDASNLYECSAIAGLTLATLELADNTTAINNVFAPSFCPLVSSHLSVNHQQEKLPLLNIAELHWKPIAPTKFLTSKIIKEKLPRALPFPDYFDESVYTASTASSSSSSSSSTSSRRKRWLKPEAEFRWPTASTTDEICTQHSLGSENKQNNHSILGRARDITTDGWKQHKQVFQNFERDIIVEYQNDLSTILEDLNLGSHYNEDDAIDND